MMYSFYDRTSCADACHCVAALHIAIMAVQQAKTHCQAVCTAGFTQTLITPETIAPVWPFWCLGFTAMLRPFPGSALALLSGEGNIMRCLQPYLMMTHRVLPALCPLHLSTTVWQV